MGKWGDRKMWKELGEKKMRIRIHYIKILLLIEKKNKTLFFILPKSHNMAHLAVTPVCTRVKCSLQMSHL